MPRRTADPDEKAREIIFGSKLQPVSLEELSRRTGISRSTLCGYKKEPRKIPFGRLCKIARRRGLGGKEMDELIWLYGR